MTRDPLYRIEQTAYAFGLAVLGLYYGALIVGDWVKDVIDLATTWAEPRS